MLSAVVVHHRDADQTLRCVHSLAMSDAPQVVVVDNSEDPAQSHILRDGLPQGARLLVNAANRGFGAACVQGMAAVGGEFVMLLNPDALALPGCLTALASALRRDPALGAVSPRQWWDAQRTWLLPPAWLPTGVGLWALDLAARSPRHAQRLSGAYRQLALPVWQAPGQARAPVIPQRALSGGAMMVRRAAAQAAGGLFDPGYFLYYEDSDLCLRLRRAGWRLGLVPNAQVVHAWHHSPAKVQAMESAQQTYLGRHFAGRGAWAQRLARSRQRDALASPLMAQALPAGTCDLAVPAPWQHGWLLEASPSALLVPALGLRGKGARALWPSDLFARLGGGDVTLRLGPDGPASPHRCQVYRLAAASVRAPNKPNDERL